MQRVSSSSEAQVGVLEFHMLKLLAKLHDIVLDACI